MKKIWLVVGSLVCGALTAEILVLSQNNLLNNGHWVVEKSVVNPSFSGSDESLASRSVLAQYKMNLDGVHGYQDISSRHTEDIDQVKVNFAVDSGAYIDILFGQHQGLRQGLRFSTRPDFSSGLYLVNSDGKFNDWQNQADLQINPGSHALQLLREKDRLQVTLDKKVISLPWVGAGSHLEFRGNSQRAQIQEIQTYWQGQLRWEETFRSKTLWFRLFILWSVIFLVAFLIFSLPPPVAFRGAVLLALWLSFDFFYFSRLEIEYLDPPTRSIRPTVNYFNFENARRLFFESILLASGVDARSDDNHFVQAGYTRRGSHGSSCDQTGCSWLREITFSEKKPNEIRVLLMGGSFYEGRGIGRIENTLLPVLQKKVQDHVGSQFHVNSFNLAQAGQLTEDQVRLFFSQGKSYQPDYIFFGSPTFTDPHFSQILDLVKYCQTNRIHLVLFEAPKNKEYSGKEEGQAWADRNLTPYHVPTLILSEVSLDPALSQSGFLWWDQWHMTDYGGEKINEFVAAHLKLD